MPSRSRASLASVLSASTTHHDNEASLKHPGTTDGAGTDDMRLPPPVQAADQASLQRNMKRKKARISLGLQARFDRFLRKLGSGTAPSTSSALDESIVDSISYGYGSAHGSRKVNVEDVDDEVDEVVVDREWSGEINSSVHSNEHGGSPEKSGSGNGAGGYGGTNTDRDSLALHVDGFWASTTLLIYLRYRLWTAVYAFFATHFVDAKSEAHYRKENWFLRKVRFFFRPVANAHLSLIIALQSLALWSSAFYVINWALATGVIPHPADTSDKVFYYAVAPAFTFPLFFMVVYDFPRDRPMLYQTFLTVSTWMWGTYQLFFMYVCYLSPY
jgi:osomolarity two-component system, sensor histidine kinase SLN1